jgi:hypothetical protein
MSFRDEHCRRINRILPAKFPDALDTALWHAICFVGSKGKENPPPGK